MQYAIPITERISQPTPEEIRIARNNAELTQAEAAQLISAAQIKPYRNWQSYEVPKGQSRVMPLVSWELFLLLTNRNHLDPPPSFQRRRESRLTFCIHENQNTLDSRLRGNDDIWAMGLNGYDIEAEKSPIHRKILRVKW